MTAGRPKLYETPEDLEQAIKAYFTSRTKEDPATITGLAYDLGFNSRQALINYENYSEEFHDTIKRAKLKIEGEYEKRLINRGNGGDIFALKNFDWTDQQTINKRNVDKDGNDVLAEDLAILEKLGILKGENK